MFRVIVCVHFVFPFVKNTTRNTWPLCCECCIGRFHQARRLQLPGIDPVGVAHPPRSLGELPTAPPARIQLGPALVLRRFPRPPLHGHCGEGEGTASAVPTCRCGWGWVGGWVGMSNHPQQSNQTCCSREANHPMKPSLAAEKGQRRVSQQHFLRFGRRVTTKQSWAVGRQDPTRAPPPPPGAALCFQTF